MPLTTVHLRSLWAIFTFYLITLFRVQFLYFILQAPATNPVLSRPWVQWKQITLLLPTYNYFLKRSKNDQSLSQLTDSQQVAANLMMNSGRDPGEMKNPNMGQKYRLPQFGWSLKNYCSIKALFPSVSVQWLMRLQTMSFCFGQGIPLTLAISFLSLSITNSPSMIGRFPLTKQLLPTLSTSITLSGMNGTLSLTAIPILRQRNTTRGTIIQKQQIQIMNSIIQRQTQLPFIGQKGFWIDASKEATLTLTSVDQLYLHAN